MSTDSVNTDDITRVLSAPSPQDAADAVRDGLAADAVMIVLAECAVEYSGRADGYLPAGNRTILIKPDGNFLVIGSTKHKPRNWQPTGADTTVATPDDTLVLRSDRTRPQTEHLFVYCDTVYTVITYAAGTDPEVTLTGTEEDMHNHIMTHPSVIEPGLSALEHEKPVENGRAIDVFGRDAAGTPVVIEVKRRRGQRKDVDQLAEYTRAIRQDEPTARGLLVAPSASDSVLTALTQHELEFVALQPKDPDE